MPPIVESCAAPVRSTLHLSANSEADTATLAQALASHPALGQLLLTLEGGLGAGKTTFVRHLLRALGVQGRIKSPTYALTEPYELPPSAVWPDGLRVTHCDFYRFTDPREWEDAGLRDLFAEPGLKLVEWADHAAGVLPPADLHLRIERVDEDRRELHLSAHSDTGLALLEHARAHAAA